jgi:hypothetical protein
MALKAGRIHQFLQRRSAIGRKLGPFIQADPAGQAELGALQAERARIIGEIEVRQVDGPRSICWAPTAAHAAVFLEYVQDKFKIRESGNDDGCITLLFRGHRDATWNLGTTFQRAHDKAVAMRKTALFTRLTSEIGKGVLALELPDSTYEAVSQHYEFETNLLDFTPDPHVAVYFAALKVDKPANEACVQFAPLSALANHGVEVLLPPPMFDRIQRQRGVFVRTPLPLPESLFSQILFPANSGFPVYRNGKEVEMLAEPAWIAAARSLIRQRALHPAQADEANALLRELVASDADTPYGNRSAENFGSYELAKWLDYYEEIRYWLTCTIDGSKEYFWSEPLELLAKFNPELVDLHGRLMAAAGRKY